VATLGTNVVTMADLAKEIGPDGKPIRMAQLLDQENEILTDIPWVQGNLITGHRMAADTSLPSINYRRANKGVALSKGTAGQFDEVCARMEAFSEVDEIIHDLSPNPGTVRLNQARRHMQAMGQKFATSLFYGNVVTNPDEFNGLASRYTAAVAASTIYYDQMVDGTGTQSDNTSIWLVGWSENTVFGIYPQNMTGGLQHNDLGKQMLQENTGDQATSRRMVYTDQFFWNCGLAVADWRYVVRICNLDASNLRADSSAADLVKLMIAAYHRIPNPSSVRLVWYVNRRVLTALHIQSLTKSQYMTTFDGVAGRPVTTFMGIPLRTVDALTIAEAAITFS
jgi:hypothetical protein